MSNRSKDRASLCSFMFVDGRQPRTLGAAVWPPLSRPKPGHPASARSREEVVAAGLQTRQRDGRERPWCPEGPQ